MNATPRHEWCRGGAVSPPLLLRNSEHPIYDGHGSERTVTNGSETVTGAINFEAFGQTAGSTGSSSSPCMYAGAWGYRTDGDAGLIHVGARYYDAQVGRFITRDTVLSEHPYLYCEHDAINWVDPSGYIRQTIQWYVNVVQAVVAKDWETLFLLIDIVMPEDIAPEVQQALMLARVPKGVNPNLNTVGRARGHLDRVVEHIREVVGEGRDGHSFRHHLHEITTFMQDAYKDMKRR